MTILFFDLMGYETAGGCEKYFSNLANYFSHKHQVYFLESEQYSYFIEIFYHIMSGFQHKIGLIKKLKRDIGKTIVRQINLFSLLPFHPQHKKIKKLLLSADVIYTKNEFQELLILYMLLGKKEFSKRVIIGVHSAIFVPSIITGYWKVIHDVQYNSFFYKLFLNSAKKIHVINTDDIVLIKKKYNVNKEKLQYVPYSIEWETSLTHKKNRVVRLLWAGRLTFQKGIDRLIIILKALEKNRLTENLEVLIAGQGDQVTIEQITKSYKNIKYLGLVADMPTLYKSVDMSIVTSYWETFGYNVLEPQSFGIPVISFNIAGPRDIIIQEETGYLVNSNEEFVKKILFYFNKRVRNNNEYFSLRKTIKKVTNVRFNNDVIMEQMERMLIQ